MEVILETLLLFRTIFSKVEVTENVAEKFDYAQIIQLSPLDDELRMMGYVIVTNLGKVIVVDGGLYTDGPKLERYINEYGGKVDSWFITHFHADHTGAFDYVVNNTSIEVENVYTSLNSRENVEKYELIRLDDYDRYVKTLKNPKLEGKVHDVKIGQIIKTGNITSEILSVKNEEFTNNYGNNQSVVIKMKIGSSSMIFLGDTGLEEEEFLINNYSAQKLKADYVQMSHHGQKGASEKLYSIISPKYCFWPCSIKLYDNNMGNGFNTASFKTVETRRWVEKLGVINYVAGYGDIKLQIK